MFICPACKAVIGDETANSGSCPKCGEPLKSPGAATKGYQDATLEATAAASQPPPRKRAKRGPQKPAAVPEATQVLPAGDRERSVSIAPRKLSMQNVEMITNTWGGAVSAESNPRSSLKLDSKSSSGMGSSLVV